MFSNAKNEKEEIIEIVYYNFFYCSYTKNDKVSAMSAKMQYALFGTCHTNGDVTDTIAKPDGVVSIAV